MSGAALVQGLVVAAVVGWSVVYVSNRLLPAATRRWQARAVGWFDRPESPAWLRALAARMQPRSTAGTSCGDSCSDCGGCAAASRVVDRAAAAETEPVPLRFHPRTRS